MITNELVELEVKGSQCGKKIVRCYSLSTFPRPEIDVSEPIVSHYLFKEWCETLDSLKCNYIYEDCFEMHSLEMHEYKPTQSEIRRVKLDLCSSKSVYYKELFKI